MHLIGKLRTVRGVTEQTLPISVVICVRNRADELAKCLDSLADAHVSEIIVVDGESSDDTVDVARSYGARVTSDTNRGLGYARRLGMRAASQPYVMFIDSDVRVPDPTNTIRSMLAELEAGGYAGLHAMYRSDNPRTIWDRAQDAHSDLTFNKPGPRETIGCITALFEREALLHCQPDPFFTGAAEDGDLSCRITAAGGKLGVAGVSVIHAHRNSFRSLWRQRVWYGRGNARRAWKDRSPRHCFGPVLTGAYLCLQGLRTANLCLLPYALVHGCAGVVGELAELGDFISGSCRKHAASNPHTS
jgi:glycosyltransferase involved in cell wall biosynthesis